MNYQVRLHAGHGKAVHFADVTIDDKIEIIGCPVWNGKPGEYNVGLPTKETAKGNRIQILRLSPTTYAELSNAVIEEVRRKQQDSR